MTASTAPKRARLGPLVLLALAVATAAPATATVIDSFTDPLPGNPLLTESARPVLFLGRACDGDACPPASVVEHTAYGNSAQQFGLAGVLGGQRWTSVASLLESWGGDPYVYDECLLRVDPAAGGSLVHGPYAYHADMIVAWGDQSTGGLNLDLAQTAATGFRSTSRRRVRRTASCTSSAASTPRGMPRTRRHPIPDGEQRRNAVRSLCRHRGALRVPPRRRSHRPPDSRAVSQAVPINGGVIALLEVRTNGGAVPATTNLGPHQIDVPALIRDAGFRHPASLLDTGGVRAVFYRRALGAGPLGPQAPGARRGRLAQLARVPA